jgi:hypothetical protein
MRALKGVSPIAVSVGLILAVTAILWQIKLTTGGSYGLVYIYLFPVILIAALYNGRLALLSTATMPSEETRSERSTNPAGSEFLDTIQEMSRDWMVRATAEVELSLKLSKKLTAAHSVPDAVAACQEWLNDEVGARVEDARLLMSNGQKFMDTTSRFLSSGWTNVGMTT